MLPERTQPLLYSSVTRDVAGNCARETTAMVHIYLALEVSTYPALIYPMFSLYDWNMLPLPMLSPRAPQQPVGGHPVPIPTARYICTYMLVVSV